MAKKSELWVLMENSTKQCRSFNMKIENPQTYLFWKVSYAACYFFTNDKLIVK